MLLSASFSLMILFILSVHVYATPININTVTQNCIGPPQPGNGTVQRAYSASSQLLAVFTCNKGYAALGQTVLSCLNGEWDNIPPFCISVDLCNLMDDDPIDPALPKCGNLSAPHYGNVNIMTGDDKKSEIATFTCDAGYYVSGASVLRCERGVWDNQEPECKPIDCGEPEAPIDGTVEFKDTHYTARAHYKCNACYQLEGYESRVCTLSGVWSKNTPKCVPDKVACPLPYIPGGGFIQNQRDLKISGVACGQEVNIRCFSGYRLIGARIATCNPDGTYSWRGATPHCERLRWS